MSACALFIIGMTMRRRSDGRLNATRAIGGGGAAVQSPNAFVAAASARAGSTSPTTTTVVSPGAKRDACSAASRSVVSPSTIAAVPFARRPYGCGGGYSSSISVSVARTPGLSSSCRSSVNTSPLRVSSSSSGSDGRRMMSATSAMTSSKSSARHVQKNENKWRVTVIPSEIPRLSSVSAMSSADRVVVPRSMSFDSRYIAPGVPTGSQTDPALIAMLIVTAGVVRVRFASTTTPFDSVVRDGARPGTVTSGYVVHSVHGKRIEPADGPVGFGEQRARDSRHFLERDRRDPRTEAGEDVDAGNRLEVDDLVRDVGDAVVLKDEPRVQLR